MEPTTAAHLQLILDEFDARSLAVARAISPQGETGETLVKLNPVQVESAVDYLTTTLNYIKALK
jgi:hypothetical protein